MIKSTLLCIFISLPVVANTVDNSCIADPDMIKEFADYKAAGVPTGFMQEIYVKRHPEVIQSNSDFNKMLQSMIYVNITIPYRYGRDVFVPPTVVRDFYRKECDIK